MGIGFSLNEQKHRNMRILILGIQSSGKSTFTKQLKILHCNGFNKSELNNYRIILIQNLFLGMKEILSHVDNLSKQTIKYAKVIDKINPYEQELNDKLILCIEKILEDRNVKKAIEGSLCGNLYEYIEIVKYLKKTGINRLKDKNFIPTNSDILHIRQRTAGINEIIFKKDRYIWNFIDVGGQRVERRKWLDFNKNLNAIIFMASLIDYNIPSEDDAAKSRMDESLDVWDDILGGRYKKNIPIILFFNKTDLFKKKIKKCPLSRVFKDYYGDDSFESGKRYIMRLYLKKLNKYKHINPSSVKCHFICALDTENMRLVYSDIKEHIIRQRLALSGI